MDIIFQSGEFYGVSGGFFMKLFGSVIGPLISGAIAIGIFIWGTKREKNKNLEKENKRISELSDYLKSASELLQKSIIEQSNHLIEFSRELKKRDFKDKTLYTSVVFKIDGIRSIQHSDLFKIFTSKNAENSKKFNEFETYLESIQSYKDFLPNLMERFNDSFHKIQDDFGTEVTIFQNIYDKIICDYDKLDLQLRQLVDFWTSKIAQWKEIDENEIDNYRTDPYIVYDNIIKPVIEYIRAKKIELLVTEILHSANNCEYHISNFDHTRFMNRKLCINTGRKLIKLKIKINEITKNCL